MRASNPETILPGLGIEPRLGW